MELHQPKAPNGKAVILVPGGYSNLSKAAPTGAAFVMDKPWLGAQAQICQSRITSCGETV